MLDAIRNTALDDAAVRLAPAAIWLALLWLAETYLAPSRDGRLQHGVTNLSLAALNGVSLFFSVGLLSVYICSVYGRESTGPVHALMAFAALDLFGYLWHRANHRLPILWRFHAVHHSDSEMDVTTSGRFHVAELGIAALLRLPLLYLLSISTTVLLVYETTLVAVSMLHHSTIRLGRLEGLLRMVLVTPEMHSVHHSREPALYGCNYASVLSIWDRLFRTFRLSAEPVLHGLKGFDDRSAHSILRLLASPFRKGDNRG